MLAPTAAMSDQPKASSVADSGRSSCGTSSGVSARLACVAA